MPWATSSMSLNTYWWSAFQVVVSSLYECYGREIIQNFHKIESTIRNTTYLEILSSILEIPEKKITSGGAGAGACIVVNLWKLQTSWLGKQRIPEREQMMRRPMHKGHLSMRRWLRGRYLAIRVLSAKSEIPRGMYPWILVCIRCIICSSPKRFQELAGSVKP